MIDLVIVGTIIIWIGLRYYSNDTIHIHGVYLSHPKELNDFQFIDNQGHVFTKDQLKGRWTLLFFGFTTCEVVCPTTLTTLSKTYEILQKNELSHRLPQVVFVSVDPQNDTLYKINNFVNSFNPTFIGIKSDLNATVAFEKQLAISAKKINNTISHSAEILLINPNASVQAYFSYPAQALQLANDYQLILKKWYEKN